MGGVSAHLVWILLLQDMNLFGGITPACHLLYDKSVTSHIVNGWFLHLSLNAFTHWWRFVMEVCISMWPSSALLITSAIISSKCFATSFILDIILSKISSSSTLVVGWWHAECDHEQSSLSFCLKRWDVLSHSLGGSRPDPPWTVLSGTALSLPLSDSTTSYSSLTLLVLGDSYALASDPPPVVGGFVVALQSAMPLVLSSWDCELMVAPVRFAPDCTSHAIVWQFRSCNLLLCHQIPSLWSAVDCIALWWTIE